MVLGILEWDKRKMNKNVSVVIRVTKDERIYRSIETLKGQDCDIIVVQNGAELWGELETFCSVNNIAFIFFSKGNASRAYNEGVKATESDIVVLCDSDTYFSENYIEDVKKYVKWGWITTGGWVPESFGEKLLATNQACFLYKSDYEKIGGHDEEFAKPNATDVAFCLRAKQKGVKSQLIPQAVYYHPPTVQKRGLKVGMAEARANKKYPQYQKTWRMIGWDVLEVWRVIRHMVGLAIGGII